MTKQIRIENADASSFKVVIEVWDKGCPEGEPDRLTETIPLSYPCAMAMPHITSTRYLVVKEVPG